MLNKVNLIGDVASRGNGASATAIVGTGPYTIAGGAQNGMAYGPAVVFPPGVTATLSGFNVSGSGIDTINATADPVSGKSTAASLISNTISGGYCLSFFNGALGTVTSNTISNCTSTGVWVDDTSFATLRGNYIANNPYGIEVYQMASVDAGTVADPGNNTILGVAPGVGLLIMSSASAAAVSASGNTWKPNVQTADINGHYLPTWVPGGTAPFVKGNNYSTDPGTPGIQLYTSGGTASGHRR